jgi:hypothetical protein
MSYDSSTLVSASSTPLGQHGSGSRGVKWLVQYRYAAAKPGFGAVPSPPLTIKPERNRSYYKLVFELNGVLSRYALRLEAGKARMKESALVDFALNLTRASTWAAGICRGNYATDTAPLGSWLTYPCTQASDSGASRALGSEQRKPELKKKKSSGGCVPNYNAFVTSPLRSENHRRSYRCFQKESSNPCPSPKGRGIANQRGKCIVIYSSTYSKLCLKCKPFMHMKVYPILPP